MYIYREIFLKQKNNPIRIQTTQDSNAIGFQFAVADWNVPAAAVAVLYIQKPSGHEVFADGAIDGNVITFPLTTQMTAEEGVSLGQVKITASDKVQNSFVFRLEVEKTIIDDEAIASSDEFGVLDTLINTVQDTIAAAEAATEEALDAASEAREPVQVGARNMLLNTEVDGGNVHAIGAETYGGSAPTSNTDGVLLWSSASSTWSFYVAPDASGSMYSFEAGAYYYLSGKIKSTAAGDVTVRHRTGSSWTTLETLSLSANTWTEFRTMMQVPVGATRYTCGLYSTALSGAQIQLTEFQLEKATVPSVYRPAIEDLIANAAAELSGAVASLAALVGVINGGTTTKGYINRYNDDTHKVGMTYTVQNSQTVPGMVIDGTSYYLLRNIIQTSIDGDVNHVGLISSINAIYTTSNNKWRLQVKITVDGTTFTKYIDLANS